MKTGYIEVVAGTGLQPSCDFLASDTLVTEGTPVNFLDQTLNNPTSWKWLFPGGSPTFSTVQDPVGVIYNTPGIYDVTLIVIVSIGWSWYFSEFAPNPCSVGKYDK